MREIQTPAEVDVRGALSALNADVQAALALSRATLHALAALSPLLNSAADAALEEEADRAAGDATAQRVLDIVADVRERLQRAPEEARMANALQRALVEAAESLPHAA